MKLSTIIPAFLIFSVSMVGVVLMFTMDMDYKVCPSNSDILEENVCITTTGNYVSPEIKQTPFSYRVAGAIIIFIIGVSVSGSMSLNDRYY